jgi:hypothetical protein
MQDLHRHPFAARRLVSCGHQLAHLAHSRPYRKPGRVLRDTRDERGASTATTAPTDGPGDFFALTNTCGFVELPRSQSRSPQVSWRGFVVAGAKSNRCPGMEGRVSPPISSRRFGQIGKFDASGNIHERSRGEKIDSLRAESL